MLQQTRNKISYQEVLTHVVEKVKKQGYGDIRADLSECEPPHRLIGKTNNVNFTPDVSATKRDSTAYFEISTKLDNPRELINKWKLLEMLAEMKHGKFQIFVPPGHMKFTQELVKDYHITAEIVKL